MFDMIPESVFSDVLGQVFDYLDRQYLDQLTPEIIDELDSMFDEQFETRFLIINDETGEPTSTTTLANRKVADDCARVLGDKHSVGILLIER